MSVCQSCYTYCTGFSSEKAKWILSHGVLMETVFTEWCNFLFFPSQIWHHCGLFVTGSESSFHRLYEEPVLRSRQPDATEEEKKIGKMRAEEVSIKSPTHCAFTNINLGLEGQSSTFIIQVCGRIL